MLAFAKKLSEAGFFLDRRPLETVQVNVGKLCNQTCRHCHVDAGPRRSEIMMPPVVQRVLALIERAPTVHTVDITGGAPELNPSFRELVTRSRALGKKVIDRCNLTVLFEKGQETTAEFLRDHQVNVIASLPCYTQENVDQQRGKGVFEKSIRGLRLLNSLGYGREGTGLELDLVYNPLGGNLPGPQRELEKDYKEELRANFGVEFNRLLTITNMPIERFLLQLRREGKNEEYMELLDRSFNRAAAEAVMCRTLVSVAWDGRLYDCDFNQMLEIPLGGRLRTVFEVENFDELDSGAIAVANHCFGCTAGEGSSCGGALSSG